MTERDALALLLGDSELGRALHAAPGGWRDLGPSEVEAVVRDPAARERLRALQVLARPYRVLDPRRLATPEAVAEIYQGRLGDLVVEKMVVVALDGRQRVLAEIEVAHGGRHGMALTASDVLRPLVRAGASAFILIHNHPSGDPTPSPEDVQMTAVLEAAADIVGVPLLDHLVVAGRGGGWRSMRELGLLDNKETEHEGHRNGTKRRRVAAARG